MDANFSRIQQVLASRVLPAVKRFSVGTEPVREAAKVRCVLSRMIKFTQFYILDLSSGQPSLNKLPKFAYPPSKKSQLTSRKQSLRAHKKHLLQPPISMVIRHLADMH